VTGAASGIGRAIAEVFAAHGACVQLLDVDQRHAEQAAVEIRDSSGTAAAHECDVTLQPNVQRAFAAIEADRPVDILVNSAGISHVGKLEDTTEADFDRVYQVNVKGIYNCMLACIGPMKSRQRGVILNLASIASSAGIADRFAYSMSKGAVL